MDFNLNYVAKLARISLTPEEQTLIGPQLGSILSYIKKLEEVDLTGVDAMAHAVPLTNVMRADEVHPSLPHEEAMRHAPSKSSGLFIVPPVIE